jgi:hypothetical protein
MIPPSDIKKIIDALITKLKEMALRENTSIQ